MRNSSGFTMLEMLVVLMIVGVLSSIAAPSWRAFVQKQQIDAVNTSIYTILNQAKSEAKLKKLKVSAAFRMNGDRSEYSIYTGSTADGWQTLSRDIAVTPATIGFNYRGEPDQNVTLPATVTVTKNNLKRCTAVVTLLGAIRQGEQNQCP